MKRPKNEQPHERVGRAARNALWIGFVAATLYQDERTHTAWQTIQARFTPSEQPAASVTVCRRLLAETVTADHKHQIVIAPAVVDGSVVYTDNAGKLFYNGNNHNTAWYDLDTGVPTRLDSGKCAIESLADIRTFEGIEGQPVSLTTTDWRPTATCAGVPDDHWYRTGGFSYTATLPYDKHLHVIDYASGMLSQFGTGCESAVVTASTPATPR